MIALHSMHVHDCSATAAFLEELVRDEPSDHLAAMRCAGIDATERLGHQVTINDVLRATLAMDHPLGIVDDRIERIVQALFSPQGYRPSLVEAIHLYRVRLAQAAGMVAGKSGTGRHCARRA